MPSQEQVEGEHGLDLASRLAPDLARSALSHLRMVVLGDFESGGPIIDALTAFLSPHSLTDAPLWPSHWCRSRSTSSSSASSTSTLSLAVFFGLAAERGVDDFHDQEDCRARSGRSATRATWLSDAVQGHLDQLSPAARELVAWMGDLLG